MQQEFTKPKDKLDTKNARPARAIVYKIKCSACDFAYYGQTNRALKTRIKEHQRAVIHSDRNSKIAQHTLKYDYGMNFENAKIISRVKNYRERLFLEAWCSQVNANSGNDHVDIPHIYMALIIEINTIEINMRVHRYGGRSKVFRRAKDVNFI